MLRLIETSWWVPVISVFRRISFKCPKAKQCFFQKLNWWSAPFFKMKSITQSATPLPKLRNRSSWKCKQQMTVVRGVVGKWSLRVVDTNRFHASVCSLTVGQENIGNLSLLQPPMINLLGIIVVLYVAQTTTHRGTLVGMCSVTRHFRFHHRNHHDEKTVCRRQK